MRAGARGAAAVGAAGAAVAVLARPRHGISDQRGLAAEFGGALAGRHRHGGHEFLSRADGLLLGRGVLRDPVDGARCGHLAWRRASWAGAFYTRGRHVTAFRYVFGAAAVLLASASLCMILMEERPLAGPATPAEMAE